MSSNTIAIIWLGLVAAFLVTMFLAARGAKPAPEANPAKPAEPKASGPTATQAAAGETGKQP